MANEKRLIDVERRKRVLERFYEHMVEFGNVEAAKATRAIINGLKIEPIVDAVEVVHGRWILLGEFCDGSVCTKCSVCGEEYTYKKGKYEFINAHYAEYNYCPNCGADMRSREYE